MTGIFTEMTAEEMARQEEVSSELKKTMETRGVSVEDLACKLGWTLEFTRNFLDKPTEASLLRWAMFCQVLGVSFKIGGSGKTIWGLGD